MSAIPIEFWFEFGSTYSYPAVMRIAGLAEQAGATLHWRPFLLGPIFSQQGWNTSPFNIYPAKGRYMWRDLERVCSRMGIAFRKPTVFPRNGLLAARIACQFADAEWMGAFVRAVFTANFADDQDISDVAVLAPILERLAQHGPAVIERAQSSESKTRLREQTAHAVRFGIFGAPSVRVGDELFWGNDRLEDAFDWYKRGMG
jgi:2-hydroxychromene-2-carboxylate isomerase